MMGILRKRRGFEGKGKNGILRGEFEGLEEVKRQRIENAARMKSGKVEEGEVMIL